jgi:hypothetical protein
LIFFLGIYCFLLDSFSIRISISIMISISKEKIYLLILELSDGVSSWKKGEYIVGWSYEYL